MGAILDRYTVSINGIAYTGEVIDPDTRHAPDELARTFSCRLLGVSQYLEAGNDISIGAAVWVTGRRREDPGSPEYTIFRGSVVDKIIPEDRGLSYIDINCIDHTYRTTRTGFKVSINSPTFTREVYLYFKGDGSGAGAPTEYVRKAELRQKSGSDYFIPFEDMDEIPLHSMRRKKADERSVYLHAGEYKTQYLKKEVVFNAAQVNPTDPTEAMPNTYVSGTPNPPASTNDDWQYRAIASFFKNPEYPSRNTHVNTIENILRDVVLVGDSLTEAGGAGYPTAMLRESFSYSKGAGVTIPDRLDEGMRVSAHTLGASTITVSDGSAWSGKISLYYIDTQGIRQTRTISGTVGNVVTVTSAFTNMVAGMRVYGCDQLGVLVTLTGPNDTTVNMVNYTDVLIGSTVYFIREIRDTATLVLVQVTEGDDFSGLAASGTLIYKTVEYTGLQINRLNWDKQKGSVADFYEFCLQKGLLPINYRLFHDPATDHLRGRIVKQYRATVSSATYSAGPNTTAIAVDDVDGFYPGKQLGWKADGTPTVWTITAINYSSETITVSGDASAISASDLVYANCRIIYRHRAAEHSLSCEDMYCRAEVIATANMTFPLLSSTTSGTLAAAPTDPTLTGTWTITGGLDEMVDDTPTTMYLLAWEATASGALEGDPAQWGMEPLPWAVASWDLGEVLDIDQFVLQMGYTSDNPDFNIRDNNLLELPLMTIEGSPDDSGSPSSWAPLSSECVARQFNPTTPNSGQLNFKCDLLRNIRHVRICVNRPFFYKQGETNAGTPVRRRDVPILTFQIYRKPQIRYTAADETVSRDQLAANEQITPYIDQVPFAQLTNKGATVSAISAFAPWVLTVPAGHNIVAADLVEFFDTSADVPFAGSNSQTAVISVTATSITVGTLPAGFAAGDKVGAARRWMLDALGVWRDLYMPNTVNNFFRQVQPLLLLEDESAQNGWDAQQIAVLRLFENLLSVRDATGEALWDPTIPLYCQVFNSNIFNPELVMGIAFTGYQMSIQGRNYNDSIEVISEGGA